MEPGEVIGVDPIDPAQLSDGLERYLGKHNSPKWSDINIVVEGQHVLVITIEAPQPGDPIHPIRAAWFPDRPKDNPAKKAPPGVANGTVFVRRGTKAVPADSSDIDMLSRRCAARTDEQIPATVTVTADPSFTVPILAPTVGIDRYLDVRCKALMKDAPKPERPSTPPGETPNPLAMKLSDSMASRMLAFDKFPRGMTRAAYLTAVDEHIEELRNVWPRYCVAAFGRSDDQGFAVAVANDSDQPIENLEVVLTFPEGTLFPCAVGYPELPHPPHAGVFPDRQHGLVRSGVRATSLMNYKAPNVSYDRAARQATFASFTLRPGKTETLGTVSVAAHEHLEPGDPVIVTWTATSTASKGSVTGAFTLVSGGVLTADELIPDELLG